jgi:glyoxylase-like metal-dependent hydrolase (beta-lactamase superfamily II)
MLRMRHNLIVMVLLGLTPATALAAGPVEKIGPDLYAYISSNDSSANSTFLVSDRGVLVVDSGLNDEEGRKLLNEIRKISSQPVRWIVNTHYHPDHRGGNTALGMGDDAVIISTAFTREQVLRDSKSHHTDQHAINEALDNQASSVNKDLVLYLGSHEVRIYHPGPAHTRGDLVVYFPDQHAVSTGDLFLNNSCPFMDDGDMENWVSALDHILSFPVEHVVPGHFAVAEKKDLRHFRDYLAALRDQVGGMYRQSKSLKQVKKSLDLRNYDDLRQFPQYEATFADNAAAYYRQLQARR